MKWVLSLRRPYIPKIGKNTYVETDVEIMFLVLHSFHETYHSPAGHWEAIYGNFEPSGIGATVFPYIEENGEHSWRTPMQDATKGRLKTSQGRMSRTFGNDNDHVDEPDYDE